MTANIIRRVLFGCLVLTGAGCSTSVKTAAPTTTTASTTTAPAPNDPVDALGEFGKRLAPDGTLPLPQALGIFAAQFAPLPGVSRIDAPAEAGAPALNVLLRSLKSLTPEQRDTVLRIVGPKGEPLAAPGSSGKFVRPRFGRFADDRSIVIGALDYFEPLVGEHIDRSIVSIVEMPFANPDGTHNFSSPIEGAVTAWMEDGTCRIRVNSDRFADATMHEAQVAHETFHCLQYRHTDGARLPLWVAEGSAGWASEQFVGGSAQSQLTWWPAWTQRIEWQLTTRSYDAIGMYSLIDALRGDTYRIIWQLLDEPTPARLFSAAPAGFRERWGTHHTMQPAFGANWTVVGPGAPTTPAPRPTLLHLTVDGPPLRPSAQPNPGQLSAAVLTLDAPGDVLIVDGDGAFGGIHFGDGQSMPVSGASSGGFCFRADGCICPAGRVAPRALTVVTNRTAIIGLAAPTASGIELRAQSITVFCGDAPPGPTTTTLPAGSTTGCAVGRWTSTRWMLPRAAGQEEYRVTGGGGVVVTFTVGGGFSVDFNAMAPIEASWTGPDHGERIVTDVTYRGGGSGTWIDTAEGILGSGIDPNLIRLTSRVHVAGTTTTVIDGTLAEIVARLGGAADAGGGSTYRVGRCTGSELELRTTYPGGEAGIDFTRG